MSLAINTLPAEIMRGVRFSSDFRSKVEMLRDGWTLSNNPDLDDGITVDGVNQKAASADVVHGVQSVSFWVTLDSTTEDILKLSATHSIEVGAGTLTATGWTAPTFHVDGVATSTITTSKAFVTVTTATPFDADDIVVGEVAAYGGFTMGDLKIWANGAVLTLQEALDYTNHATWDWVNKLTYDFPLRMATYDPTNKRTVDSRSALLYAVLGDGAGTGEPTQTANGYMEFDGVNDYLSGIANPTGSFTVLGMKDIGTGWEFFSHNDLTEWTPIFTSGGLTGNLAHLALTPSVLTQTQLHDATNKWTADIGVQR